MDNENQQQGSYEASDISLKMYKKSLIFYVIVLGGFLVLSTTVYYYFIPANGLGYNNIKESSIPYSSRLQGNVTVQKDMVDLRAKEHDARVNYRWLNVEKTKVSLPLRKAMDIVLKEGMVSTEPGVQVP